MSKQKAKGSTSPGYRALTIVGIILCIILIPILIVNCTLLIKGYTNKDEVPDFAGIFPMIVYTDSMKGEFDKGDLIICKTIEAKDVKKEDVITFFDPASSTNALVTHRVKDIQTDENGKISFITKGDYNNTMDSEPVPAENLVGIYTDLYIPAAGSVALFLQRPEGLIVSVVVPILLLVAYELIRHNLYEKKHSKDKDALMQELEELRRLKAEQEGAAAKEEVATSAGDTTAALADEVSADTPAEASVEESAETPAEETPAEEPAEEPAEKTSAEDTPAE